MAEKDRTFYIGATTVSHETYEDVPTESLALLECEGLEREPRTGFDTSDSSVAVAVRTRRHPHHATNLIEEATESAEEPERVARRFRDRFPTGVSWGVTVWMFIMHIGAVAALWYFTWQGLALLVGLHFVTACLGVTLGFHRLLTHGSLVVSRPVKYFFSICGMLSAEGSPLMWVATHRKHHVHSDQDDDPHSPNHGFWWSHMLWFSPANTPEELEALLKRWAPDLYKDPCSGSSTGRSECIRCCWESSCTPRASISSDRECRGCCGGLCARMVFAYHSTWFVNSATHIWGYRNYETTDRSRNLWWVALLSYGEGWHNNHHAHQRLAVHGHRWWEVDVTYMVIRLLKATGLAKKVQDQIPAPGRLDSRRFPASRCPTARRPAAPRGPPRPRHCRQKAP